MLNVFHLPPLHGVSHRVVPENHHLLPEDKHAPIIFLRVTFNMLLIHMYAEPSGSWEHDF